LLLAMAISRNGAVEVPVDDRSLGTISPCVLKGVLSIRPPLSDTGRHCSMAHPLPVPTDRLSKKGTDWTARRLQASAPAAAEDLYYSYDTCAGATAITAVTSSRGCRSSPPVNWPTQLMPATSSLGRTPTRSAQGVSVARLFDAPVLIESASDAGTHYLTRRCSNNHLGAGSSLTSSTTRSCANPIP
jgi:hypothetical protein